MEKDLDKTTTSPLAGDSSKKVINPTFFLGKILKGIYRCLQSIDTLDGQPFIFFLFTQHTTENGVF
ncbi:MAG: hypothetical protein ABIR30_02070 [Chitinophagaceae bacterium]